MYQVDTVDMIDGSWRDKTFTGYDAIFHVAGIAHQKESKKNASLYYKVNRDLAVEVIEKAMRENVKQFVYLSSMSVYGLIEGVIRPSTVPAPTTHYGKSKLEAEKILTEKANGKIKLAILRPPMVYGEGCKGNYARLCRFAQKAYVFPDYQNRRSMVSIEHLVEYVSSIISEEKVGFYYPQDRDYLCTSDIVRKLADMYGRKIWFIRLFNPFIKSAELK
jgi:UDP-glucose 4-epimerase